MNSRSVVIGAVAGLLAGAVYWFGFSQPTPPAEAPSGNAPDRTPARVDSTSIQAIHDGTSAETKSAWSALTSDLDNFDVWSIAAPDDSEPNSWEPTPLAKYRRLRYNFARRIVMSAVGIELADLVRQEALNPSDRAFTVGELSSLRSLLEHYRPHLKNALQLGGELRNQDMRRAIESGAAVRKREPAGSVPDPRAYGAEFAEKYRVALRAGDYMYYASYDDLPNHRYGRFAEKQLNAEFGIAIATWFFANGFIDETALYNISREIVRFAGSTR